jgi:hypothetical protein
MNIAKCPNPTCTFQFDASLVPPGAVIACPQCRLQFQLPQLPPVATPPPVAVGDPTPTANEPHPSRGARGGDRGRSRDRRGEDAVPTPRKGNTAALVAVLVVGLAFVFCGGVGGVLVILGVFQKKPSNTSPYTYPDYTLSYSGPGEGWQEDKELQGYMKVNLACFKSSSPEGYIAVRAMKSEGEAAKGDLLPALKAILTDRFDDVDDELSPSEVKLLGGTGEKYEFAGVYKPAGTGCRGEVHAVAVRNLKVWVYCWAERDRFDELAPAFDKFRAGMKLEPRGGEPKVQRQQTEFRTNSGLYLLTDSEGLWRKQTDPTRQDAAADLWLIGSKRTATTGQLDQKPSADLVVAVLDPKGDAKAQAKEHILAQNVDGAVVNEQVGDPLGESPSSGQVPATDAVTRMKMTYPDTTGSADKLVVFTVVDTGGKRVVAYGWCQPRQASYWEQRLMLLVGTLKGLK